MSNVYHCYCYYYYYYKISGLSDIATAFVGALYKMYIRNVARLALTVTARFLSAK